MWIGFLDFLLLEDTTFSVLLEKKKQRPRFMLRTFMFNENLPARDTSVSTRQHHVLKKMTHRT